MEFSRCEKREIRISYEIALFDGDSKDLGCWFWPKAKMRVHSPC